MDQVGWEQGSEQCAGGRARGTVTGQAGGALEDYSGPSTGRLYVFELKINSAVSFLLFLKVFAVC